MSEDTVLIGALAWARAEFAKADKQRALDLALYVPPDALPHVALKHIRDFIFRTAPIEDPKATAVILVALDRVIDNLCACKVHVVYERHGGGE